MNDDEYKTPGKSIAELHGLAENDPWQQPETEAQIKAKQKAADTVRRQEAILERLRQEGKISDENELMPEFIDPDDDEDMRVRDEKSVELFWRMVVPDRRLKEIVHLEPDILKVGLAGRNNALGCWVVFTNKRIAERLGRSLDAQRMPNEVHSCDISGNQVGLDAPIPTIVDVEGHRPWKPTGPETEVKAEEFFYCILQEGSRTRVCFVPEIFWNEHQTVYPGSLGLENLLGSSMEESRKLYSFDTNRDYSTIKPFLDSAGFRENLLFHAYISENIL